MSEPTTALERRAVPPLPYAPKGLVSEDEIGRMWKIASSVAQTGLEGAKDTKGVPSAHVVFAKILMGRDLGMSPMQAIMSIDFVKGSPMIRGVALLAFVRRHPLYDYDRVEQTPERATLRFYAVDEEGDRTPLGDETYTFQEAMDAGIVPTDKRSAWHTARKNMVLWRCASNGVKFLCPDIFGGVPIYTEGDVFLESRDGETAAIEPARPEVAVGEIIDGLLIPKVLRGELKSAISDLNAVSPGSWGSARAQMTLVGQTEDFIRAEIQMIRAETARAAERVAKSDEEAQPATEVPVSPDAVVVGEEPTDSSTGPACPICGRGWDEHDEEEKATCSATADEATE